MDQDLCGNCGRWREQHYNTQGIFIADLLAPPCVSYQGVMPGSKKRAKKEKEIAAHFKEMNVSFDDTDNS